MERERESTEYGVQMVVQWGIAQVCRVVSVAYSLIHICVCCVVMLI